VSRILTEPLWAHSQMTPSIFQCNPERCDSGVIEARDIRRVMRQPGLEAIIVARDMEAPAKTLISQDSLLTAIGRMVAAQSDELVVVDDDDPLKMAGTISRSDVIAAYDRHLLSFVQPV
jgi:CBS-domain-containing membrane protein